MTVEQEAFLEKRYRENFRKLLGYAMAVLENEFMALDVVQDTFCVAVIKIDVLMAHENPDGWLMETLRHKIRDQIRAHHRYAARFVSLAGHEKYIPGENKDFLWEEPPVTVSSILEKIENVLIPEDCYLLRRIVLDGCSHREVAEELNITVWASQKRLERIRKALERFFPEHASKHKKKITPNS